MVVLDTDLISLLERKDSPARQPLQARLEQLPLEDVATTIISYEEQTRGWLAYMARARTVAQQVDAYRRLYTHLNAYLALRVLEFDDRAAEQFQRLTRARLRVGPMDQKIAAIVLAHDATLLSRNLRDFRKVNGLKVEDWTA
jgi:tRNA(fMet)-specific endonuclease VapC